MAFNLNQWNVISQAKIHFSWGRVNIKMPSYQYRKSHGDKKKQSYDHLIAITDFLYW